MSRWFHDTLLAILAPITMEIGKINMPVAHRKVTADMGTAIAALAAPGDCLLSHKRGAMSNLFIPGYWKHLAMAVGDGMLVEAIGSGVRTTDILSWCQDHDAVLLKGPTFADAAAGVSAANFAKSIIGMPYDDLFEFFEQRNLNHGFYCSKVLWWSWDQVQLAKGLPSPFKPHLDIGVPTIVPDDIARDFLQWKLKLNCPA